MSSPKIDFKVGLKASESISSKLSKKSSRLHHSTNVAGNIVQAPESVGSRSKKSLISKKSLKQKELIPEAEDTMNSKMSPKVIDDSYVDDFGDDDDDLGPENSLTGSASGKNLLFHGSIVDKSKQ